MSFVWKVEEKFFVKCSFEDCCFGFASLDLAQNQDGAEVVPGRRVVPFVVVVSVDLAGALGPVTRIDQRVSIAEATSL